MDEKNLKTLSERLRYALHTRNMKQKALADHLQITPQMIYHLCKGNVKHSQFTNAIAEALQINPQWLAYGKGSMYNTDLPSSHTLATPAPPVPLLALNQIQTWLNPDMRNTLQVDPTLSWLSPSSNLGTYGFACWIPDKSLFPRFDTDTVVFVNPEYLPPSNNRFVVAYLDEMDEIVIRRYEQYASEPAILRPLHTKVYNTFVLTPEDKILGTIVESRWRL